MARAAAFHYQLALSIVLLLSTLLLIACASADEFADKSAVPNPSIIRQEVEEKEKFIWPLLSDFVGVGNQLMEYMSAAVVAHALNRTLCLTPFHEGPAKHNSWILDPGLAARILSTYDAFLEKLSNHDDLNGGTYSGALRALRKMKGGPYVAELNGLHLRRHGQGLALEDRYNEQYLGRFVKVASVESCLSACHRKLEATWFLRNQRKSNERHFDSDTTKAIWSNGTSMKWSFVSWTTTEDVKDAIGNSNLSCVALGGLFPGLRWRGAYLAVAAYLTASQSIAFSATSIQRQIMRLETKYLAVHWRFEESFCGGRELGSCFLRCGDGAIVNTGLHPLAKEWIDHSHKKCHFHGVKVTMEDVAGAIYDRAVDSKLSTVYLATDGWIRGREGAQLISEVVKMLRGRNLTVVGLWRISGLPNFPNGNYIADLKEQELAKFFGLQNPHDTVSNRLISGVEQEICNRAEVFLGSGQSTWSLAIFRSRLAHRRARAVLSTLKGDLSETEIRQLDQAVHDKIIHELLSDEHEAGLLCGYHRYYNKFHVNATKETFEDEAPDGWLDLEACEMRIGRKGGHCEFATCT